MRSIREAVGGELVWRQPRATKERYELHAGDEVLATLGWARAFGSLAEAVSADGSWTFKRVGFWQPRATIRAAGSDEDLATFEPRWTGSGVLTLPGGTSYHWGHANAWGTKYAWRDASEREVIRFGATAALLRSEATVEVAPEAAALPDLPLLMLFGWYLTVMGFRDAAGATAAAANAGVVG